MAGKRRIGFAAAFVLLLTAVATSIDAPDGATATASRVTRPLALSEEAGELLYVNEGNRLRRIDVDTIGSGALVEDVLVERANLDPVSGRDINGEICARPDAVGGFVAGEDTGQPSPPPGWGVFDADGIQVGKLTATYLVNGAEPFGCEFAPDGTLFTTEVGSQGFGTANGQLIQWFPPYTTFPGPPGAYPETDERSTNYCKLATDLGTAGAVTVDDAGRVYVSESSGLRIDRFSPPFPSGPDAAGGCGGTDSTGAPVADVVQREVFATPSDGMLTFSGLAMAPNGNLYAASVLTGRIAEYDLDGDLVRLILAPEEDLPPVPTGHPQGITVGDDGTIYYADLDLVGTLPDVGPGPNGKVWRIRFDGTGNPLPPEIVRQGLAFPDGVGVFPGDLESTVPAPLEWPTLAGGPNRSFFNPRETALTAATAPQLIERWRFRTEAVVTSSPSIATVNLPARGRTRAVFFSSWDGHVYALDWATGEELWRFAWEDQPGASFPAAGAPTIADVGEDRVVFIGAGETMYALDAATGTERWSFAAGTGCRDAVTGQFPGLCSFRGERNQVESTPIVADGIAYFGMDINDVATGKGGFYAVDAALGTLEWYFDPESGAVCRPNAADEIRNYDGYHSEVELGLPVGFFASRSGCDHPRTPNGCGNVWSSPAHDAARGLLFFGTSNCDTDDDPASPTPPPPMPPYDEAIVALHTDGSPAWRWRPREIDNDDLAFGAAPNLFSLTIGDEVRDVLGIGGKDGTYYVIDREGVNARNAVNWNDDDPSSLPYWQANVVPGGDIGGILGTAAVDEFARRVYFSTAPGLDIATPQRPTVHALDLDTGAVVWQNEEATGGAAGDASFGPTSAVPGVVFVGSVVTPHLRMYDATTGALLVDRIVGEPGTFSGVASGAAVLDGTLVVGAGIGTRTSSGSSPGDFSANTPSAIVALCVPGTPGCEPPRIVPGGASVAEGDSGTTTLELPVKLSRPIGQQVTAEWTTFPHEAAIDDFVASSGTVTFAPSETEATIAVQVRGDTLAEADETFFVSLRNPTNAKLGGIWGVGFGVILDDEPVPKVRPGSATVTEGDNGTTLLEIPVQLSTASDVEVTATFSTRSGTAKSPGDFVAASGTLTFAPGETEKTVAVQVNTDAAAEPSEHMVITVGETVNAEVGGWLGMGFGFITDDD